MQSHLPALKEMILAEKARGKTILLTTHNMQDVAELCDRVAFIVDGRICALDSPHNLSSLNQFILWTVPVEIAGFVPAVLHLFEITPSWFRYYPVNVCMEMVSGTAPSVFGILIAATWTAVLLWLSGDCVLDMWSSGGGGK